MNHRFDSAAALGERVRSAGVLTLALLASVGFLIFVDIGTPLRDWLALQYLVILFWQVVLNLAWVSVGFAITKRLLPQAVPFLERLSVSVTIGVAVFYVAMYGLGAIHLFRPAPAVALTAVLIAVGARPLKRWWDERRSTTTSPSSRSSWNGLALAATVFGALGIAVVYLGAFTPGAINYDASWYHLPIAESYAREGRIVPFDGNWHREYPHLAPMVHTWAFLVPGLGHQGLRWMMVLHTEVALFVWTLVGIAAVVNWLLRNTPVRGAWSAMFLFPGIFVYDGNIGGAADHVLAFFAAPLFLLSVRAPQAAMNGAFGLWGAVAGAAVMTKYQGIYTAIPLGIVLLGGIVLRRREMRPLALGLLRPAVWLATGFAIVTAPHFIKNTIFHGNPVYPLLQDWFTGSHPTIKDAPTLVENIVADRAWRAPPRLAQRVKESLELIWTFPFKPHYSFMNDLPTFGFAYSLALPLLLFVRDRRRLLVGAVAALGALFVWASTYRVDRHLQILLPLLVASAAAILVSAWRLGRPAKVGVAVLVGVQLVWAADLYTVGLDRIGAAVALIHTGRDKAAPTRFAGYFADQQAVGEAVPKDAIVLLHHWHQQLGINRPVILDWVGFQGLIDYRTFSTPRDVYDRFQQLRISHVVHVPGYQASQQVVDVVLFDSFAFEVPGPRTNCGQLEVFPMPAVPPPFRPAPLKVVTIALGRYADGLYPVTALDNTSSLPESFQRFNPPEKSPGPFGLAPLLLQADAAVAGHGASFDAHTTEALTKDFALVSTYPELRLYLRTTAAGGRRPFVRGK